MEHDIVALIEGKTFFSIFDVIWFKRCNVNFEKVAKLFKCVLDSVNISSCLNSLHNQKETTLVQHV